MGKIQYLQNFLYSTAKAVFRIYLLDGGEIAQGGLLLHQLRLLLDEAYHEAIKEVAAANAAHSFGAPSPKEPPEDPEFPPPFSSN